MAICSASDYKAYAGISGTTYDARLALLIPYLQDKVENYCRRDFDYSASITEKVDGSGTDAVYVAHPPIASIASITITYGSSSSVTLSSSDFNFTTDDSGRIWLYDGKRQPLPLDRYGFQSDPTWGYLNGFPVGRENVTVVYAGGYGGAGPAYPPSLVMEFMNLIAETMLTTAAAAGGTTQGAALTMLKSKRLGQNAEDYRDLADLSDKAMERFFTWRRVLL